MDKNEAIKIAQRYADFINKKFQVVNVILFGSFAKGTNHINSDIDLAIVFKTIDDVIDLQIELMKMRTDDDLLIEPHPFSLSDFQTSNPVVSEILKSGIEIRNYSIQQAV